MTTHVLFEEGVRAVIQRWTALNLAVSNNWGEGDSNFKREAFVQQILSGFMTGKAVDPSELEQFLDEYLVSQFSTEADDDSPYEVSHLICKLFELITAGSIEEAQSLFRAPAASLDSCVEASSDDEESDTSEMQEDCASGERESETIQLTAEQQADIDDGWGVVVRTSKGRLKELSMDQS